MTQTYGKLGSLANKIVSLNQKFGPYLGIGEPKDGRDTFKVWLSPQRWCIRLPGNLTDAEEAEVMKYIDSGVLVEGRKYLPAARKNPLILVNYMNLVKTTRGDITQTVKKKFEELVFKRNEGNWSALEILRECLKFEEGNARRNTWIAFFKEGIKIYNGPEYFVEDNENHPDSFIEDLDIVIGQVEQETASQQSQTFQAPVKQPEKPKSKKAQEKEQKEKEDALRKHLG